MMEHRNKSLEKQETEEESVGDDEINFSTEPSSNIKSL
jgi:hypothetical protein